MEASVNFTLPVTINDWAELIKSKFSISERLKLAQLIQKEEEPYEEPTKEQLMEEIREAVREVNLAKKGKLKLQSLEDFLNEL